MSVAFRHMSWEQRQRRHKRRRQRRVAAAAVTLAGGQMAWMIARDAQPAEALEVSRSLQLVSRCEGTTPSCDEASEASGGVTAVDVSADGRYVAFITQASLVAADANTFSDDVYVVDTREGRTRWITDQDNPGGFTWSEDDDITSVAISGDGRYVTWVTFDVNNFFLPPAVPIADGDDTDENLDVLVATIDDDGDGSFFTGGHTAPLLVSVDDAGVNLGSDSSAPNNLSSFEPTISHDGRFIAFTYLLEDPLLVTQGQQAASVVGVHDRDVDEDGVFDEQAFPDEQTTTFIDSGSFSADDPDVSAGGDFIAYRAFDETAPGDSSGVVRVWRRSDGVSFDVTAGDFTGGDLTGTIARTPSISADGTRVAYDFEYPHPNPVEFGDRNQTVVVEVDPGLGTFSNPYIASKDPTDPDPLTQISDSTRESRPVLSDDGRYVAYDSNADNVAEHIGGGGGQIYVVDLLQLADEDRVPVIASAVGSEPFITGGNQGSYAPAISGTGQFVAFGSSADDPDFFFGIDNPGNAFRQEWQVDVEADGSVVFPDTAVGGTSAPINITFDTDDFGPWTATSLELLDSYVDSGLSDYTVVGDCVSTTTSFHANDPCTVQVAFEPLQLGNRVAELCLAVQGAFGCAATATAGGQAVVPDAPGPFELDSLDSGENQIVGGEGAFESAISANGRYVAFTTDFPIDPLDVNNVRDVYVRDRLRGTTTLVSFGPGTSGTQSPPTPSFSPTVSGDGRFIAYQSDAEKAPELDGPDPDSLPEVDGPFTSDIFLLDRGAADANGDFVPALATTSIVSVWVDGGGLFDDAVDASISGDGTQIAFTAAAGDEGFARVLVRDRTAVGGPRTVQPVFAPGFEVEDTDEPSMSADGLHVAMAANVRIGTTCCLTAFPIRSDVIFVYDRDVDGNGVRDEASPGSRTVPVTSEQFTPLAQAQGDTRNLPLQSTFSFEPAISGDGSTVAYGFEQNYDFNVNTPPADRLTPLPIQVSQIVTVDRDVTTGAPAAAEVVSVSGPGDPNLPELQRIAETAGQCFSLFGAEGCGDSTAPDISDDGRYVTFATQAENLVTQPASSLPGFSFCGDGGECDIIAVDRIAPSNAGAPQHVNAPPVPVLEGSFTENAQRQVDAPAISGDGRFIAFEADPEFLLGYVDIEPPTGLFQPVDDNGTRDVFVREWQPVVEPSAPVVFPDTALGATSAAQTASATTQDFGPAPVLGVELVGANPGDFVIIPASSVNCFPPLSTAPAAPVTPVPAYGRVHLSDACSVAVAFRPTAVGARTAVLRVTTGDPFSVGVPTAAAPFPVAGLTAQTVDIPLSGGGAGQGGFSSQPSVDLGSQIVTTTSPEGTVTVTNTGTTPFQISSVALEGVNPGDFTIVGTDCVGFLAPGASCTVRVTFTPTAPGERTAVLRFNDTAVGGPHLVGLTGRAPTPTLVLNPGVIVPGRTVQVQGLNWAPNQVITLTTADANNPTVLFSGSTQVIANAFGGLDGSILFFPKTTSGPRIVIATGTPPTLTAFQPLLISMASINGLDFVNRG